MDRTRQTGQPAAHAEEAGSKIQWHTGFVDAMKLEFYDNKAQMAFRDNVALNKAPRFIDLLVIVLLEPVFIANEIGRIFRKYNLFEYKSPGAPLSIGVFAKLMSYAYSYKYQHPEAGLDEITVTMLRHNKPRKLMRDLKAMGYSIEAASPGVYHVKAGELAAPPFPTQIIVTRELPPEVHDSLRVLARDAAEDDLLRFLERARRAADEETRLLIESVLQVSVPANEDFFRTMKGDGSMHEILREVLKDDLDERERIGYQNGERIGYQNGERIGYQNGERAGYQNGERAGERRGREEGRLDTLFANVLSVAQALGKTFAEAMDILSVTPDDRTVISQRLAAQ